MSTLNDLTQPTQHDLPHIQRLLRSVGLDPSGVEQLLATTLILTDDARLIGCVSLEVYATDALLRSLAVDPAYRGRDRGQELLDAAIALAQQYDVNRVYLLTETAAPFFATLGWSYVERAAMPVTIQATQQWQALCPASAKAMVRRIG